MEHKKGSKGTPSCLPHPQTAPESRASSGGLIRAPLLECGNTSGRRANGTDTRSCCTRGILPGLGVLVDPTQLDDQVLDLDPLALWSPASTSAEPASMIIGRAVWEVDKVGLGLDLSL